MASTGSRFFRSSGAQWSAVVCIMFSLLAVLPCTRCPVSLLHVDASDNLALLDVTRSPVAAARENPFRLNSKESAANPFLQYTVKPLKPSTHAASAAPEGDSTTVAFGVKAAFEKADNTGEVANSSKTDKPVSSVPPASQAGFTDQIKNPGPQVPFQDPKWSQSNRQEPWRTAGSGPVSTPTLEGWASLWTPGIDKKMPAEEDILQTRSEGSPFTRPNDRSPSVALTSTYSRPAAPVSLQTMRSGDRKDESFLSALASLHAILTEKTDPATTESNAALRRSVFHTEGREAATSTMSAGQDADQRNTVLSPYDKAFSSSLSFSPAAPRGSPRVEFYGAHVPTDGFKTLTSAQGFPQLVLQSRGGDTGNPWATATHTLGGPRELRLPRADPDRVPGLSRQQQQQEQLTEPLSSPLECAATRRPQNATGQPGFPCPDAAPIDSKQVGASYLNPLQEILGNQAALNARLQGGKISYMNPASGGTDTRFEESAELDPQGTDIRTQLQRMGYREGRELPPTKGVKMMASGIALGLSGVLSPPSAVALLGLGALRFLLSKRAQSKAALATPAGAR